MSVDTAATTTAARLGGVRWTARLPTLSSARLIARLLARQPTPDGNAADAADAGENTPQTV